MKSDISKESLSDIIKKYVEKNSSDEKSIIATELYEVIQERSDKIALRHLTSCPRAHMEDIKTAGILECINALGRYNSEEISAEEISAEAFVDTAIMRGMKKFLKKIKVENSDKE